MIKFKRESDNIGGLHYYTLDGRFHVWQEPYRPKQWYTNESDGEGGWRDACPPDGHERLADVRLWLIKNFYKGGVMPNRANDPVHPENSPFQSGITIREYTAIQIMSGFASGPGAPIKETVVLVSELWADALLKELAKSK